MKIVVSVSLGANAHDYEIETSFLGRKIRVLRFGANGDENRAAELLRRWGDKADAIGLGGVRGHVQVGTRRLDDPQTTRLERAVTAGVPVVSGAALRRILHPWAVRWVQSELAGHLTNARVLFPHGVAAWDVAAVMAEFTGNLWFADPILDAGFPKFLTSLGALELYARGKRGLLDRLPAASWLPAIPLAGEWNRFLVRRAAQEADVVVATFDELERFGVDELAGKTVFTSALTDEMLERLRDRGVNVAVDGTPRVLDRVVSLNVLEAMIHAALDKGPGELRDDELLERVEELRMHPRLLPPAGTFRKVNRFAFVVHPLSQEYFKKVPAIDLLSRVSPRGFLDVIERVMPYAPPLAYSRITGIRSPTGVEAEGWLISVGGTPREILSRPPEFTYRKLLQAAEMAERLGAQIMGLGAFTKVVGDAGVTVARRASIPITSGNSYTVSAALWAAREAVARLGFVPIEHGKRIRGKAMVIGATGSIGSACARLLALVAEEVHLVSPEVAKLLALEERIRQEAPETRVHVAEHPGDALADMDLVITATSAAGRKVLDILAVKPGCVICDVARPLDLAPEDVALRPDVLVIESGEIELPGELRVRNVGLPPNVVWACLAEVVVLTLAGRFEVFTIGRNIELDKVREIYKLGLEHGMRLAAMSGVNGVITDEQFARVRELALERRPAQAIAAEPSSGWERANATSRST